VPRAKSSADSGALTVALGEYDIGWHDPAVSLIRVGDVARQAAAAGVDLLVLPEMCITGFTMDPQAFAEPEDGPSIKALGKLAAEHGLWIIAGASIRKADGRYVNSALTFSPQGKVVASYEKQRLFGYAGETDIYSPGETHCVVDINGLSFGVFICFDLRFPELFREVGRNVDGFVLVANWPNTRQQHWDVLSRARAIENQCYMIGVNRIGEGGGLTYDGGSVIFDPWGDRCDREVGAGLRIGEVSTSVVERARKAFPLPAAR
jgi:predicted amidohydrolase